MKSIIILFAIALTMLTNGCRSISEKISIGSNPLDLRVMTFNIRNGVANDGLNSWQHRTDQVKDVIINYAPDIVGIQEAFRFQMDDINNMLPNYGEIGEGRYGGTKDEYCAIIYLKERFSVNNSGTFWLSDTPDVPSSHWGNNIYRICTWAHLTNKISGNSFYIYNTHLDHRSQNSREKSVKLVMQKIESRNHNNDPFILTGDFNASETNSAITYLKAASNEHSKTVLIDTFRKVYPNEKVVGTSNRFKGRVDGAKIDYIFVTPDTDVIEASIIRVNKSGRYPSDHFPVTAQIRFN